MQITQASNASMQANKLTHRSIMHLTGYWTVTKCLSQAMKHVRPTLACENSLYATRRPVQDYTLVAVRIRVCYMCLVLMG